MTILAIGDSFTFGSELSDIPAEKLTEFGNEYVDPVVGPVHISPSKLAWPSLLAAKLNQPVTNLGLPGGSNDRIFRLAMTHTAQQLYDIVICAWTVVSRFDFVYRGRDLPMSAVNPAASVTFPWFRDFVTDHFDPDRATETWLIKLLALQSWFAQRNQRYLFVNAIHVPVASKFQYLVDQIDLNYYVDFEHSMLQWCVESNMPIGKDNHFLEQGHELVANVLHRELQIRF